MNPIETKRLLDDQFAPITNEIGFVEASCASVATSFLEWYGEIGRRNSFELRSTTANGNFNEQLRNLLPLVTPVATKRLFNPTQGSWTAYFDNFRRGTDSASVVKVLADRLKCRAIRVVSVLDCPGKSEGGVVFELYAGSIEPQRTVYCVREGSDWEFGQSGRPLDFESIERLTNKPTQQRLTHEMLNAYLLEFGIDVFNSSFYNASTNSCALLVERLAPQSIKGYKEYLTES